MDRFGVRQVVEDSGEQREMEETGCEVICGTPTPLAVKVDEMCLLFEDAKRDVNTYFIFSYGL